MARNLFFIIAMFTAACVYAECRPDRIKLQVLGSGGPEMTDGRASTSYLIGLDGKALILVDAGSGSALNFERSSANLNDLKFMLFSHFHVDHSAEFPAFIKAFYFSRRDRDLLVYGPEGNALMPAASEFVEGLVGAKGVYRYLSEYVDQKQASLYKIRTHDVSVADKQIQKIYRDKSTALSAVAVHHGPIPALAWRVEIAGCALSFSGDMNNDYETLSQLAKDSDILIAHLAIPEKQTGAGRRLHMPPSVIGKIAAQAKVKQLVLSHRMRRTLGNERDLLNIIRRHYPGKVTFAEDLAVISGNR